MYMRVDVCRLMQMYVDVCRCMQVYVVRMYVSLLVRPRYV